MVNKCKHAGTKSRKVDELKDLLADIGRGGETAIRELAVFLSDIFIEEGWPSLGEDPEQQYQKVLKTYFKKDGTPKASTPKLNDKTPAVVARAIEVHCKREEEDVKAEESESDVDEPPPSKSQPKRISKATPVTADSVKVFKNWNKDMIIEWMLNNMPEEDIRECIEHTRADLGRSSEADLPQPKALPSGVSETKGGRTGISIDECYNGIYVWGEDSRDYAVFFWDYADAIKYPRSNDHWWGPFTVKKTDLDRVAQEYCVWAMAIDDASAGRKPKTASQRLQNYPADDAGVPDWLNADDVINEDWDANEFVKEYDEHCYYKSEDWPNCKERSGFGQSFVGAQGTVGTVNAGDNFWGVNPGPGDPYGETLDYQEPNFCGLYNQIPVVREYPGPTGGSCKFGKRKRKTAKRKTAKRKTVKPKTAKRKTAKQRPGNTPTASAKSLPVRTVRKGRDGKRYIVVIRASGKAWKKVDRSGASKRGRKSPSISASTQPVGTKKRGNDGNMWVIKTARSSSGRRYRVWRRA